MFHSLHVSIYLFVSLSLIDIRIPMFTICPAKLMMKCGERSYIGTSTIIRPQLYKLSFYLEWSFFHFTLTISNPHLRSKEPYLASMMLSIQLKSEYLCQMNNLHWYPDVNETTNLGRMYLSC
jgi:hypothetical protein